MRWGALVLIVAACGSSTPPPADPQLPADAAPAAVTVAPPDAGPPEPCITDEAAKAACEARGEGFAYGPAPWIYCRGIPPEPGEQQRWYQTQRSSPCSCNDLAAIAQRRHMCSQVP